MMKIVFALVLFIGAFVLWRKIPVLRELQVPGWVPRTGTGIMVLTGAWLVLATSYVYVGSDEVGLLNKIYGVDLPKGQIIAADGEKGYQARVLGPQFHVSPLLTVINDIDLRPVVEIPKGYYGVITTTDGKPLPEGQIMAPPWKKGEFAKMLDGKYFLTEGGGYKGLQTSVLKTGKYRLNLHLYRVRVVGRNFMIRYGPEGKREWGRGQKGAPNLSGFTNTQEIRIPAGHVGVVKSNVSEKSAAECKPIQVSTIKGSLRAPLVPRGCRGVWIKPLYPGGYFLNKDAYEVVLVDTRVQTWSYQGGYDRRDFQLTVDQEGRISQKETVRTIPTPKGAADAAIFIKVEGWDIPLEMSVLVQVDPKDAPVVVASVGNIDEVENKVMTPLIRSQVRNVIGAYKQVFALQDERAILEKNIEAAVQPEGAKYGVTIKEVRLREPYLPPELRVARLREQLAGELVKTFLTEQKAQQKRIAVEHARAIADQQPKLVEAEISVKVAEKFKLRRQLEGQAQEQFLKAVAAGERERANVLGAERVMVINIVKEFLSTLERKPEILGNLKLPSTFVAGRGLEGFGAVLGGALGSSKRPAMSK